MSFIIKHNSTGQYVGSPLSTRTKDLVFAGTFDSETEAAKMADRFNAQEKTDQYVVKTYADEDLLVRATKLSKMSR